MKIASLILSFLLLSLIGLVVLFEVTPDRNPKEDGDIGLLIIFFVLPFLGALGVVLLIAMSKEDKHK